MGNIQDKIFTGIGLLFAGSVVVIGLNNSIASSAVPAMSGSLNAAGTSSVQQLVQTNAPKDTKYSGLSGNNANQSSNSSTIIPKSIRDLNTEDRHETGEE